MRELRSYGSVRGAISDDRPYRDPTSRSHCQRMSTRESETSIRMRTYFSFWKHALTHVDNVTVSLSPP